MEGSEMEAEERISPFSQGTQFLDWIDENCEQCVHAAEGCKMFDGLIAARVGDGTVSREIADRLGVPENTWSDWQCKELQPRAPAH
jgi:hypothetical protein